MSLARRRRCSVGVVETAGGVRSPQAVDGDATDLVAALGPDVVVLVADAGLGTINGVRLSMDALGSTVDGRAAGCAPVVVLDRFDGHHDIHRRNRGGWPSATRLPGGGRPRRGGGWPTWWSGSEVDPTS